MTCIIGCDHAGLALAKEVLEFLSKNTKITKLINIFPQDNIKVDYPDYASLACKEVLANENSLGILICGSGIGMSIMANRFKGIRAALCVNEYMAKYARAHNDANILCLGERILGFGIVSDIIRVFLETSFEGGRHKQRIDKINLI
ncbi:ribose 5-phosphate isomerase B [Helicobacter sp. MIT 14-3879]|uniref:ribose 5-phosphate isomerase B n=1 Tax=Helicobacter sp. MIT 14-3879 TaxID=2040649 RepID=UPI000E1E3251|nr:ribose 5-phosphate isomerase B [Helicobacter sp. MIT 14-3879]RDU64165.1 ribose 5-phosphate isomerase B [Helicobacter sp. MIT 14-3879]